MTDKLPPLATPTELPAHAAFSPTTVVAARNVVPVREIVDEEPYTIKCICNFTEDDGNTIYCEKCDTWQHIECYYPNNVEDALREDFAHSCAECEPRFLDRQRAIERQTARTAVPPIEHEAADKKQKRPPSKSHKKKPKPHDLQLNGHHGTAEKHTIHHEHNPPPKKAKSSHKPSQSVTLQASKRSPSYGNAKNHGNPPSPATTPPELPGDFEIHSYSRDFICVHQRPEFRLSRTNSFATLVVTSTLSDWTRDEEAMIRATDCGHDIFQKLPSGANALKRHVELKRTKKALSNTTLQWQQLKAPLAIGKGVPLIELNGLIGFQSKYCEDPDTRWAELLTPLPFVFFHPYLPLFIDARTEGSEARFVRQSCRPNATLETFLSDDQYHFWFVSDRFIDADEEITIPWDFRLPSPTKPRWLQILGLGDEDSKGHGESLDEGEYQSIKAWVHTVLSEHGGCACNQGADCAFARFHRKHHARTPARAAAPSVTSAPKSKKRKAKAQHAISPTSTGHATNSRAASEGHLEDVTEQDARSVSGGSSRSKPPSRDLTPTARQGSFDTLGILTEPTDRDKRKVVMIEENFRRMEQDQHHAPRKRKRVSDGSNSAKPKPTKNPATAQTPTMPNGVPERPYADAGTSELKSKSPAASSSTSPRTGLSSATLQASSSSTHHPKQPKIPSKTASVPASVPSHSPSRPPPPVRPQYCDVSVQTDPEEHAWYSDSSTTAANTPRRRIVSLSKRLLESRHRHRFNHDEKAMRQSPEREPVAARMDIDSPTHPVPLPSPGTGREVEGASGSPSPGSARSGDVTMADAATSPSGAKAAETPVSKHRSPELRVQMPPVPAFGALSPAASTTSTPLSTAASAVLSPFSAQGLPSPFPVNGTTATPSPVKKKLSLSDWTKSRANKAAAGRPSIGTTMLKPIPGLDEPKSAASTDTTTNGAFESPTTDKPVDVADATPQSAPPA